MNSKMMYAGGMAIGNALARGEEMLKMPRMGKAMGGTKGYAKGGAMKAKGYAKGGAAKGGMRKPSSKNSGLYGRR